MKKLIIACMSIIIMMMFIAQPMFIKPIKANAYNSIGVTGEDDATELYLPVENLLNYYGNDSMYIYWTIYQSTGPYYHTYFLPFDDYQSLETDTEGNAVKIVKPKLNGNDSPIYHRNVYKSATSNNRRVDAIYESTVDTSGYFWAISSDYNSSSGKWAMSGTLGALDIRIAPAEPVLDLDVTFNPSMSGTVTRNGTANGADITYNYLNLNIKNYGDNAQWLFCIVPHGQSLSFPNAILNTPQGFIGSPTFVWVCDEWIDWTNGLTGITGNYGGIDMQMLYAPCAWHTLITGSDRTYRINWDMMKLSKDVSYDCVVYGMINEEPVNASDSGTGLGCWTVKSALSGITEVYRSTFTMPNPPEFNPDSIDEGNSAHAWNPDIDNSSLFNHGSVYKDANGNLVIKGSSGITNGTEWELGHHSGSSINTSSAFGGFFGLIKGIFGGLPSEFYIIIMFGLVAIVAVGIIKAVK